ncbi:nicotinate phosphoribosyltransferase [Geobacter sp. SVR]|uniref:nicotinate phosphoribosyltransferase n=1 Tax=Geobacter sp. SVR TaxID=2495594 RepID=UPI00143EF998|nr:nicotinate phosphoribosyltransferase [Geobacter sp. SVR]BCS52560.1 nicotinate phosphoribosyltransferase [Geobacter sp. SVR]GCF84002.1 nicotinate phosphoribosyltransferase [Geobacter sp. SVR]
MRYPALLTDLYELTMLAGYLEEGMADKPAIFDLFFRTNPFEGSYAVFAGLGPALDYLEGLRFLPGELRYLQKLGIFRPRLLEYLREFRFGCTVTAPPEGTVMFANEPLLTVEGRLAEAQLVETALLNMINFQTLVATKAARISHAAGASEVIEFGLRRAHGPDGGLSCARAAAVGGVRSTSNVQAGMSFGLPVRGTHAHSWVLAFPDELTAFRAYAAAFPDSTVLLVDTFDTLKSGLPNAITVARELRGAGHELRGIRLDSGDLAYLSRESRRMLDETGFPGVRIMASNELDEHVISSIREEGGQVDYYGVGTRLATCTGPGGGALGGVYKLVAIDGLPKLKLTSDISKATLPGKKRLLRGVTPRGDYIQDVVCLEDEQPQAGDQVFDPANPLQHVVLPQETGLHELRCVVMENGRRTAAVETLDVMAERCRQDLARLPQGCLRLVNPHRYKVSVSGRLNDLKARLLIEIRQQETPE